MESSELKLPDINFKVKKTTWFSERNPKYGESSEHFYNTDFGSFDNINDAIQCFADKLNLYDFSTFEEANKTFQEQEMDCDLNILGVYLSISYKYTNLAGFASYLYGLTEDFDLQPYNGLLSNYPGIEPSQTFQFKEVQLFANDHLTVGNQKDNHRIFDVFGEDSRVLNACQAITEQLINYGKELNIQTERKGEDDFSL